MLEKEHIVELLSRPASKNGVHAYLERSKCWNKALLDASAEKVVGGPQTFAWDVGTLFHEISERYHHTHDEEEVPRELEGEPVLTTALEEAWRLFGFYSANYPRDAYGEVLYHELPLSQKLPGAKAAGSIEGRLDLVVRLTQAQADAASERDGLPWTPGIWVVDFKTHGAADANQMVKDSYNLQTVTYPWLLQQAIDDGTLPLFGEVQGTAYVHVIRHAKMSMTTDAKKKYRSCFVNLCPTQDKNSANCILNFVDKLCRVAEDPILTHNLAYCVQDYICPHLLSGACNRGVE